jgi:hypothetical protein
MLNHLSVVCPFQIPISMSTKKIWVQQGNVWKITYCLVLYNTNKNFEVHLRSVGWRSFSKTAE